MQILDFFQLLSKKGQCKFIWFGMFRLPALGYFSCVHSQQKQLIVVGIASSIRPQSSIFSTLAGMHISLEPDSSHMTVPGPCSSLCSPH